MSDWDESKHPRKPEGSAEGGQWTVAGQAARKAAGLGGFTRAEKEFFSGFRVGPNRNMSNSQEVWEKTVGDVERTPEEQELIDAYSNSSESLNNQLRKGKKPQGRAKLIDEQLRKDLQEYTLQEDTVLMRGASIGRDYEVGDEVADLGWTTTSTSSETAREYATYKAGTYKSTTNGGLFAFRMPKGTPIVPGSKGLREVLLAPGMQSVVVGIDELTIQGQDYKVYVLEPKK